MKLLTLPALLIVAYASRSATQPGKRVDINDNRKPAGALRNGVLALQLEARVATWHPDAANGPGVEVQAFAERGRSPQIPGPLIRVPSGTVVDVSVHNAVPNTTLVVHGLSSRLSDGSADTSSIAIPAATTHRMRFRLDAPGTYYYWATTSGRRLGVRIHEDAQLTGAIVVDNPHEPSVSHGAA